VKLQYDTSVSQSVLDREVVPHLDKNVTFKDPWQTGYGKSKYTLGMTGFHCMFYFNFSIKQLHVYLNEDNSAGRVLVDGIMHLNQLQLYSFPLRTLLVYNFVIKEKDGKIIYKIKEHEEMWSFGDMIENLPLVNPIYQLFRRAFGVGFLMFSIFFWVIQRLFQRPVTQ